MAFSFFRFRGRLGPLTRWLFGDRLRTQSRSHPPQPRGRDLPGACVGPRWAPLEQPFWVKAGGFLGGLVDARVFRGWVLFGLAGQKQDFFGDEHHPTCAIWKAQGKWKKKNMRLTNITPHQNNHHVKQPNPRDFGVCLPNPRRDFIPPGWLAFATDEISTLRTAKPNWQ